MRIEINPRSLLNLEHICEVLYKLHPSVLDVLIEIERSLGNVLGFIDLNNTSLEEIIIIFIIMLWRFGGPHLYWAKIFRTDCENYYMNYKLVILIKAALGFPSAILLHILVRE